jgi:multimeric flavodoxin WrbA
LVKAALEKASAAGAGTGFIKLIDLDIRPCTGCGTCRATGVCVQADDMDEVIDAIQAADALVLGSPVYMGQVTGTMKIFMDRLVRLLTLDYGSRLNGRKRVSFVYSQGNPDASLFRVYFDYHEQAFRFLGFEPDGRVVAVGTRMKEDVLSQPEAMGKASDLGESLAQ